MSARRESIPAGVSFRQFATVLGLLATAGAFACKDFLNVPPQGNLDQNTLASRTGVEGTLIAAYRELDCNAASGGSWGCAASNWVWSGISSDDAYTGSNVGDPLPLVSIELYYWSSADVHGYLDAKWITVYEGVSRANATLRLLEQARREQPREISAADARGIEGEALFLRAHYHFEAWRMWGNIPYYREADTDFRKSNVGVNVPAELLKDLDSAIVLLPDAPRNGDKGRVTRWVAQAYKGRVQMYAGDFAGALATLRDVAQNGPYALETSFDHVWTGFAQYENGPETILAYQASVNDGEPSGWNSNWGERLNFPHTGSHFGCCGFHQPSQNLVNYFAVDANGLPLALSDSGWNGNDANVDSSSTTPVDPRLDWTVGRDGVPYKDWGPHEPSWIRDRSWGGPYSPKKNVHESASGAEGTAGWTPTSTNGVNIHLFRYADMLLMLAEAEVEAGALENARTIVNEVRTRAAAAAQGPGTDAASIAVPLAQAGSTYSLTEPWAVYRIGSYTTPWTDQASARAAVRAERRLELAMEGQRFFDLRRWHIADPVLNDYLASEGTRRRVLAAAERFSARHALYPIPAIEIEMSRVGDEDRLVQNPGW